MYPTQIWAKWSGSITEEVVPKMKDQEQALSSVKVRKEGAIDHAKSLGCV